MIKSEDWNITNGNGSNRKRGRRRSNYTNIEKQILIELTDEFKDIIENKECNTLWLTKKRDAWNEIARRYNTAESSGLRTWQQLRHWYDNHKQSARKSLLKPTADNGSFPALVKPEPYCLFEVRIEEDQDSNQSESYEQSIDGCHGMDDSNEQNRENHRVESINEQFCQQSTDDGQKRENHRLELIKEQYSPQSTENSLNEPTSENHRVESIKEQYYQDLTNDLPNEQNRENHRTISIKEQYYREKIKNAKLEKHLLINQNRMAMIRHRKEMELLKLKLKILEERKS